MKHLLSSSLIALAVASSAVTARAQDTATTPAPSPGGFRLPTNPTPAPTDVQGPVDPDAPILTRPRDTTPTPTPRPVVTPTPTPRPVASPTPRMVLPPRGSTLPPRFTPPAIPTPQESEAVVSGATPFPEAPSDTATLPVPPVATGPVASPAPTPAPASVGEPEESGLPGWLFAAIGGLLAIGLGAFAFLRRRKGVAEEAAPVIERPRTVPRPTAPEAATPPPAALVGPALLIEANVKQLARSVMAATLSYELRVTNRSAHPLENVVFGGDFVTAHARIPTEQQLADPAVPLTPVQSLTRLDPGESAQISGDFRLPISEIRPIPHGSAVVYVPLLRVRAEAAGMDPIARTFVVGLRQPGAGTRLQPFRLDEMPQTYRTVGQQALD